MNENNFDSLRQLLALKRHEVPPPGYFNSFSGQVIARIQAGEANEQATLTERLTHEAPWLIKFLQLFEAKPAFAGAFASALCLLLLFGIVYAERPDAVTQPLLTSTEDAGSALASLSPSTFTQPDTQSGLLASTNPVMSLQPVASLFGQQNPFATPVSYSPGNQ